MAASDRLVIVESPSKAKTLAKFLGAGYRIEASMGHVRDLPKSKIGVDVEHGYKPDYVVIKGREKQIKELRALAKKAGKVLLAADPDREGEAIAWHLSESLDLKDPVRIVFHEITKSAVEEALAHPREIDRNLVSAQEARRVIDRLVGYKLSPLLWRKVKTGLSAGRVQSVAVRLVVDRENEIEAFVARQWWTVEAILDAQGGGTLTAKLVDAKSDSAGEKELTDEAEAKQMFSALGVDDEGKPGGKTPKFKVVGVEKSENTRNSPFPYTTSTMQQDASNRLRFSPKRTMVLAQQLYEGIDVGEGSVGLITYMRTDSVRIADSARDEARGYIAKEFGKEFIRGFTPKSKAAKGANVQDAHEAIRPTDVTLTPDRIGKHLDPGQAKLYELIWRRYLASQMSAAKFDRTAVTMDAGGYRWRATGSVLRFEGFLAVWKRDEDNDEDKLPLLKEGQELDLNHLHREEHTSQPPARFTEASLIKELEEKGIGRPSTYAPTIDTIEARKYVRQEERRLFPTQLGKTVDSVLRENFPQIVDVEFTAQMEKDLDEIESGKEVYLKTVDQWYKPFEATVKKAEQTMQRVKIPLKETGESCPECKEGQLVIREGRFGEFVGCSRYPECKYIRPKNGGAEPTGEACPDCGKPLVTRVSKRGPFIGCSGYPDCRYVKPKEGAETPTNEADLGPCPECGKALAFRKGPRGQFIGCTGYPTCRYAKPIVGGGGGAKAPQPTGENCPECGKPLVERSGRFGPFIACSGYPTCKYRAKKTKEKVEEAASA